MFYTPPVFDYLTDGWTDVHQDVGTDFVRAVHAF